MHYYVTYREGGKFKRVHCPLSTKQQIVNYEHSHHEKLIIFFQSGAIYDDWFKGLTGMVWRDKAENKFGIECKFDKLEDSKEIEDEWIEDFKKEVL